MVGKKSVANAANKENGGYLHHPSSSDSDISLLVTEQRRSSRGNLGHGGHLTQLANIERIQTTKVPPKKVNPALQSQPVNVLAPQAAKKSSKPRTVEDPAVVEPRPVNPRLHLAVPGERYGFALPATESEQRDGTSDLLQFNDNDDEGARLDEDDDEGVRLDEEGDEDLRHDEEEDYEGPGDDEEEAREGPRDDDEDEAMDTRTHDQGAEVYVKDEEEDDSGSEYDRPGKPNQGDNDDEAMDIDNGNGK
jgi:hypothetical protein